MRQRRTNRQMAMPQVYPGTVEGVAEAVEVETVAARLMKRLQLGIARPGIRCGGDSWLF